MELLDTRAFWHDLGQRSRIIETLRERGGQLLNQEVIWVTKAGALVHVLLSYVQSSYQSGHISFAGAKRLCWVYDITLLRQREIQLAESLQQQTATAEILKVISASRANIQPVLEVIAEHAVRLCDGQFCAVFHFDGELIHVRALHGMSAEGETAYRRGFPLRAGSGSAIGRAIQTGAVAHIPDVEADAHYKQLTIAHAVTFRAIVAVPMLREDSPIGGIAVSSSRAEPFSDTKIALLRAFADQAVIAIENVRLFDEVRARTEALTRSVEEMRALGEVGQAVSSTLNLETVLTTIVAKAAQLSGTEAGAIYVFDEAQREFRLRATYGMSEELIAAIRDQHAALSKAISEAAEQGEPNQVGDLQNEPPSAVNDLLIKAGYRRPTDSLQ
jgi:GAF domain-containing protein